MGEKLPVGTKIVVYHTQWGCETGCCGHTIGWLPRDFEGDFDLYDDAASLSGRFEENFEFSHPYKTGSLEWAKEFVREHLGEEHVADLDWEHCIIVRDEDAREYGCC